MSRRRRRANNFTDSLNSFQYSEVDSDTPCSMSQDSIDEIKLKSKSNQTSNDVTCNSKHSIILASSSSKHSLVQNSSVSSSLSSKIQSAPDLNKRIDLLQDEQLCTKIDDYKENNNPQCYMEDNDGSNKLPSRCKKPIFNSYNKSKANIINENSKRDSNYNIHDNMSNAVSILEQNIPKITSLSQLVSLLNCTNQNKPSHDTTCEDKHTNNETKKFETILYSLDNQLNRMKEVSKTQQILKRLSDKFVHSPKNFTEKLLSIIEEATINNDDDNDASNTSAIDLSRLTTEFRKMCKFIENESSPEWPPSPMSTFSSLRISASPASNKSLHIGTCKNDKLCFPVNTATPTIPISGIDITKKRLFNISRNNYNKSTDKVINESSNTSFEHLEAQCKRLFPEEKKYSKPLRRSLSMPSLLSMSQIHNVCEQQMASLNASYVDEDCKEKTILSASNLLDKSKVNYSKLKELCNKSKNIQDDVSYSKKKSRKINERSDFNSMKPDNAYATLDPDELEKTLLQDIAEKRKRCLDTARLITEINADPKAIEARKTLRMSPMFVTNSESNSLCNDETKFLQTLMSCKDYQSYLEKQKPLFKLIQNSNPNTPETSYKKTEKSDLKYKEIKNLETKNCDTKKTPNTRRVLSSPNVKSCSPYKTSLSKKQVEGKKGKGECSKPKLFVTPGKTSALNKDCKKKREYFPTMISPAKNVVERYILKSPNAEGLYRLNYDTIMSPVGMYIRGTDMPLIKNVRVKTDRLFLTPVKKSVKISPSRNSKQNTSSNLIAKTQEKTPLKLNLSPKIDAYKQQLLATKTPENDSTPKSHFVLPKVSYKLPLRVKTVKEVTSPKLGARVKKLLENTQNKVVIRHQGRIKSVQKGKNTASDEVYEINYEPEDESMRIEETANKTNFIHNKKK